MKVTNSIFFLCFALAWSTVAVNAQKVEFKPFSVTPSDIINQLKAAKSADPKIATEAFVKTANELLEKQGINYTVAFDAATCQKISQAIASVKDKSAPLNLRTALKSPLGENANLILPEVSFAKTECVPCFVRLPIFEVSAREFVTSVEGRNIKFFLPSNFLLHEVLLVDEKDLTSVRTRWKIPFRTTPLSVSDDGNILYLGFPEPELSELVLMIYAAEGVYQFGSKGDIDATKKSAPLKDFPKDPANPALGWLKFGSGETAQVLKFSAPCPN